jgi:hypothetical protein
MGHLTNNLYKQISGWRLYSVIAPTVFCAISTWLYLYHGAPFEHIFYTGLIILSVTCIIWWHWSLSAILTMLLVMKDTDDHFETVTRELNSLHDSFKDKTRHLVVISKNKDDIN